MLEPTTFSSRKSYDGNLMANEKSTHQSNNIFAFSHVAPTYKELHHPNKLGYLNHIWPV
jgi:hypothetical protein